MPDDADWPPLREVQCRDMIAELTNPAEKAFAEESLAWQIEDVKKRAARKAADAKVGEIASDTL